MSTSSQVQDWQQAVRQLDPEALRQALAQRAEPPSPSQAAQAAHQALDAYEARLDAAQQALADQLRASGEGRLSHTAMMDFLKRELDAPSEAVADIFKGLAKAVPAMDWGTRKEGRAPLHRCASLGLGKALSWLITHASQDPGLKTPLGLTPAHLAAESSNIGVLRRLAGFGVSLDVHDQEGRTPSHLGARLGRLGVLRELKRLGADLSTVDGRGRTVVIELEARQQGLGQEWIAWEQAHEARLRAQQLGRSLDAAQPQPPRPRF